LTAPILSVRNADAIARAGALLAAGELVIIPTDTVYGIAALPQYSDAIIRLYAIRNRPPEPAFPLLLAESRLIHTLTRPNPAALRLARRFWPGALTLILPPSPALSQLFKGMPIALRVPNFPVLTPLLRAVGGYLFVSGATSAGYPPAITAQEASDMFGDEVSLILDGGRSPYGVYSTIVDCVSATPAIPRRGAIPEEKIWEALADMALPDSVVLDG